MSARTARPEAVVTLRLEDVANVDEPDTTRPDGGPEVEKWILRSMLIAILATAVAGVLGSLDDIKRYLRIRQM